MRFRFKKTISMFLAVLLVLTVLPMTASAVSEVSLSVDTSAYSQGVTAGDTIVIPINMDANTGLMTLDVAVDVDEAVFEYVSAEAGTALNGADVSNDGTMKCNWFGANGSTGTGTLFTVTLRVRDTAPSGETTISLLTSSDLNLGTDGSPVMPSITNGTVTVNEPADYDVALVKPSTDLVAKGGNVSLNLTTNKSFSSAKIVLNYDKNYLTFVNGTVADGQSMGTEDQKVEIEDNNGTITIVDYGAAFKAGNAYTLNFTAVEATTGTEVAFTSAGLSTAEYANTNNLLAAKTTTPVSVPIGYSVTVNSVDTGVIESGETYTLDLSQDYNPNYEYTVDTNVGTVQNKGNGVWEISGITDNLTVTWECEAIQYDVSWTDQENLVTGEKVEKATCDEDIVFTIPANIPKNGTNNGTNYVVTVVRTNADASTTTITPSIGKDANGDQLVTINKIDITGDLAITVKSETVSADEVTLTIEGSNEVKYEGEPVTSITVQKNSSVELTLNKETGYDYTVTVGGQNVQVADDGKFTVNVGETDVAVIVSKKLDTSTVEAKLYLSLDTDTTNGNDLYLVYIPMTEISGKTYKYGEQKFFYSKNVDGVGYDAYCVLVEAESETAAKELMQAENALSLVAETATQIDYTGDVNKSGSVDINDAQIVWNMYNVAEDIISCTKDTMEKYLRADVNGDKLLNVAGDAVAVVSKAN